MEKIKSFAKKHPVWSVIIVLVVIGFIGSLFSSPDTNTNSQPTTTTQTPTQSNQNTNTPTQTLSSNPLERIEQIVDKVGDYEVTIWDSTGDFATESSTPYEVIVNSKPNQFNSCFDAKNSLYEIMKGLYSDSQLNGKIARVQFTAWGYLKASLGYDDAKELEWNVGPSNYWKVTLQYKDYEDTSSPLSQQTWGVKINQDCD